MKLLTLALASILSTTAIYAQESKQADKTRVLIAMEQTDFKKKLITNMEQILKEKGMEITVVKNSEKELESFNAPDYDLVFITNSGVIQFMHAKSPLLHLPFPNTVHGLQVNSPTGILIE